MFSSNLQSWDVVVEGTYGQFSTTTGSVSYLLTKAKLGQDTSLSSKLTPYLAPVREVLNIEEMDFNQLLQRDLDDHRVATDLIDYILKPQFNGPAFYTPILAALLPFEGAKPINAYPPKTKSNQAFKDSTGNPWQKVQYGDSFQVLKLADPQDESGETLNTINLGRLEFNKAKAKLVVIDGQHRAMALIAIRRTIAREWGQSTGSRFSFFYERRIQEILKNNPSLDLNSIEFPVCICWFPDTNPTDSVWPDPHRSARKLFVDVNQNAKKPSPSRVILLSDSELTNIFVRALLNSVRQNNHFFPLHTIEYDYPHERGEGSPVRVTALANILMLENAIQIALRGDRDAIAKVNLPIKGGKKNKSDADSRLRQELEVKNWLTQEIEDEGITDKIKFEREDITNEQFPRTEINGLTKRFLECWGKTILEVLSQFYPFRCHIESLNDLENNTVGSTPQIALAQDAMFKGLGMYWTLRDSYLQWQDNSKTDRTRTKADTVEAWEVIQEKEETFKKERARLLFDKKQQVDDNLLRSSENTFVTLRTQAFLSGAILTLATLKLKLDYDATTFADRALFFINAWNNALQASPKRLYLFDRKHDQAFLRLSKLEPAQGVYFRYTLLELMACNDDPELNEREKEVISSLVVSARSLYLNELKKQQEKSLRRTELGISAKKLKDRAEKQAEELLRGLCKYWFGLTKEKFNEWLAETKKTDSNGEELDPNDEFNDIDEFIDENNEDSIPESVD